MKYIFNLRDGLETLIVKENAFIIGEDIQEPYGGAFKVTKGLSEKYPENIIGTPMCEQGFTGMGIGMAIQGCNVVIEIMFGDFITLVCDQLINHACKFYEMYKQDLHLIVRCPSGGYRGYGATHSQSLEKMYMGIPGMQIVAPSIAHEPAKLLEQAMRSGCPTLFVENKLDYPRELLDDKGGFWIKEYYGEVFPVACIKLKDDSPELSIIVYGGMVPVALEVMRYFLYEEEIGIELIIPSLISAPLKLLDCIHSKKAVVIEEGVSDFGWGAEIAYHMLKNNIACTKMGAENSYIPVSKTWEEKTLLMPSDIINQIKKELDLN